MIVTLLSRRMSAALRERPSVMNRIIHSSSPGSFGSRPIGRSFASPGATAVANQQERAFATTLAAPASSRFASVASCSFFASDIDEPSVSPPQPFCLAPAAVLVDAISRVQSLGELRLSTVEITGTGEDLRQTHPG